MCRRSEEKKRIHRKLNLEQFKESFYFIFLNFYFITTHLTWRLIFDRNIFLKRPNTRGETTDWKLWHFVRQLCGRSSLTTYTMFKGRYACYNWWQKSLPYPNVIRKTTLNHKFARLSKVIDCLKGFSQINSRN